MAKLAKDLLKPEQIDLIHTIRQEYIDALTKEFDDNEIVEKVKWLYKLHGLREPYIHILDNPLQFQKVKNIASATNYPEYNDIGNILFKLWKQLSLIDKSIMDLTKKELVNRLYLIYEDHIKLERIICNITWYSGFEMERQYSVPLLALYDYFLRIGLINDKDENIKKFLEYIRCGIRYRLFVPDNAYIIRNNTGPQFRDELGRLNNEKGYAVIWKDRGTNGLKNENNDGSNDIVGFHFVKGIYFQPDLFEKIFIKENITSKEIFEIKNTEQKAIALHHIGYDRFIKELNAKKLDEWKTDSIINGNVAVCSVYEFNLGRSTLRFVKVQDHSTGKTTVLGVPIEKGTDTAKGAVAWTFGFREEEYNPEIET